MIIFQDWEIKPYQVLNPLSIEGCKLKNLFSIKSYFGNTFLLQTNLLIKRKKHPKG